MKKTTEETIQEIEEKLADNLSINPSVNYAVLYFDPHNNIYENVDWKKVAEHFKTEDINSYNQGYKIVIDVDPKKFPTPMRPEITSVQCKHPTLGVFSLYGTGLSTNDN